MALIILDRDGVINYDSDNFIRSADAFIPIPGSLEAIARLSQANYKVAVATNQSGIGRGLFDLSVLNAMHAKLHRLLADVGGHIELIAFCPHRPEDDCPCRKPRPGLYREIADRLDASLQGVPIIGDSLRDLQAAQAVGAQPILVRTGKGERTLAQGEGLKGIPVHADLAAAVDTLLLHKK